MGMATTPEPTETVKELTLHKLQGLEYISRFRLIISVFDEKRAK